MAYAADNKNPYGRIPVPNWLRRKVFKEANGLCQHCSKTGKFIEATELDHINPWFNGGTNDRNNLQALCHGCHNFKSQWERGLPLKGCCPHGYHYSHGVMCPSCPMDQNWTRALNPDPYRKATYKSIAPNINEQMPTHENPTNPSKHFKPRKYGLKRIYGKSDTGVRRANRPV